MGWNVVPWGCRKVLEWISDRYDKPVIYITESGCALPEAERDVAINDNGRIDFLHGYLQECQQAIANGVDLRGYFIWSLMDNFEWECGYSMRFGLHYVDYATLERIPKKSAGWYSKVIQQNSLP